MRRPASGYIVQVLYHYLDDRQTKANIYLRETEEWKANNSAPEPIGPLVLIHHCKKTKSPWGEWMWEGTWHWQRHFRDSQPIPESKSGTRFWSNPGLIGVDLVNYHLTPEALRSLGFAGEVSIVDVRCIGEVPNEEA